MTMREEYERIEDIKETHSLRVSSRGEGYCLYLPRSLVDQYGLITSDRVKVELRDHYRLKRLIPKKPEKEPKSAEEEAPVQNEQ
jgi:hypothetical protein